MLNQKTLALTLAIAGSLALHTERADACTLPSSKSVHRYWSQTGTPTNQERCTYQGGSWKCHLSGWLYTPSGTSGSNLPALVFVHGSGGAWNAGGGKNQQSSCDMINFYVSRGYVVFSPIMRGVGDKTGGASPNINVSTSAGFANTGTYIGDYTDQHSDPSDSLFGWFTVAAHGWGVPNPDDNDIRAMATLEYMDEEVDDIQLALTYLANLPGLGGTGKLINPNKIALSGHSFGGQTVTLASSHSLSPLPKVVINMSGGALSWASSVIWNNVLTHYAAQHKQPLDSRYNDAESSTFDFSPGLAIFQAAVATGVAHLSKYGTGANLDVLCGYDRTDHGCYHTNFQDDAYQVSRWAPDVLDFMHDNGM
jgi:dienelactone hydrolase